MDLNRAMVDLYKQRQSSGTMKPKRSASKADNNKSNGLDQIKSKLTESMLQELESSNSAKSKMTKIEEAIAALDIKPKTTFEQLCGFEYVQGQILRIVDRFKRSLEGKTKKSDWPVLICGSRGLGKTALVEAAANLAGLNLIPIQLLQLVELTRNEFKESLEQLIRHSINNQPAIVLIDDLEQITDKEECRYLIRGAVRRLLADQLKLLIFCTTSSLLDNLSDIDFLLTIHLKRPTLEARLQILSNLRRDNQNLQTLSDECLQAIATNTPSFTALDLRKMLDIAETESEGQLTMKHCETAVEVVKQSFKRGTHLIGERPTITWSDIGGMTDVRQAFSDILRQTRRAGRSCKFAGVALYGPPGCGKTMVAQAMANEAGFNFISIKPAELVDKFLGETEKNIRRVFHEAREHEPCMIYFDEFDGLCGTRGNKDTVTSAIQTLLSEMDGFINRGQSIIMVSTNRLEDIDPAMKRPGRLSKHIYVGPPDQSARRDILSVITNKPWLLLAADVDLDMWAAETNFFTGAELDFLVAEAEAKAISELAAVNEEDIPVERVTLRQEHLVYAMNRIQITNKELDKKTRSIKRSKIG